MTHTKNIVMSRVRAIHRMRPFVGTGALCAVLVMVSVYAVSKAVWVDMVLRNMPSPADFAAFTNFFAVAFLHTGLMVQAFSLVAIASALWFVVDATRSLTSSFAFSPTRA